MYGWRYLGARKKNLGKTVRVAAEAAEVFGTRDWKFPGEVVHGVDPFVAHSQGFWQLGVAADFRELCQLLAVQLGPFSRGTCLPSFKGLWVGELGQIGEMVEGPHFRW